MPEPNAYVTDCVETINAQMKAKADANEAIWQSDEEIAKSHAPLMIYGKYTGTVTVGEGKEKRERATYDLSELKVAAFTGSNAAYLASFKAPDPRFMAADQAIFPGSKTHVRKGAKSVTVVMQNPKTKKQYTKSFFNLADLSGPNIPRDFTSVIDPKRDEKHQEVLRELGKKKNIQKFYQAAYYAYRDVTQARSHTIDALGKSFQHAYTYQQEKETRKEERAAQKVQEKEAKSAMYSAYDKACEPYRAEFQKREDFIRNFQPGKPVTPATIKKLPQEYALQVMKDNIDKTATNRKGETYQVAYAKKAAQALYDAKVPKKTITAILEKFAPLSAYDPARKDVLKKPSYAEQTLASIERAANKTQAAAR